MGGGGDLQFVGCLATRVNSFFWLSCHQGYLFTKSLHGTDFYSGWGEDLQFVGCLASRVNNPPLILFTKSLHVMVFTVQFVGCLFSMVNNPPILLFTKSLHEKIFTVIGGRFAICWLSCQQGYNPPTYSLYKEFTWK